MGIISSIIDLGGQALNRRAEKKAVKEQRKWDLSVYERQRTDSLKDWNTQNAYNTPEAQMGRYRDAGLNPNLIYGQSNEAGVVRSTDFKTNRAPDYTPINVGSVIDRHFNTQMKEAQIDNLKAQNDNILAQKNLIEAQTKGIYKNMENLDSTMGMRSWDLENKKSLAPYNLEIKDWTVRHQMKDMDIKTQNHEYDLMKRAQDLQKGGIDIINARIDTSLKKLDYQLKEGAITRQQYETEYTKTKMAGEIIQQKYMEALKENVETRTRQSGNELDLKTVNTALGALNSLFGYYRVIK